MALNHSIKPLVLIGPSGSGRAAISFRLISQLPNKFDRVISTTSRSIRPMQKDGYHYYFRTQEEMLDMNKKNQFVTFVLSPHSHYYGTQLKELKRIIDKNRIPILKVTLAAFIKNIMNEVDCHPLYIKVPDMGELQRRLHFGPYDEAQIKQKLQSAASQQRQACKYFQKEDIIQNKNIEEAIVKIKSRLFEIL